MVDKMKYNFGIKTTNRTTISHSKNQNTFIAENATRKPLYDINMDSDVDIRETRCDYLIIEPDNNFAHFIELKGSDIDHAFKQLENSISTIENIQNGFLSNKFDKRYCYIVIHRSPASNTKNQQMQIKFKKNLQTSLDIKTKKCKIQIH